MSSSPKKGDKASSKGKPPKDSKEKDTKSKKSKEGTVADKKEKKKSSKAEVEKDNKSKSDLNQSQMDISFFKPPLFLQSQPPIDQSYVQLECRICQLHKEKNILFCELCQQPGCQNCTVYGPHNSQMHRVSKLEECYKARYLYLNELVCGGLINRRDAITRQMEALNQTCEEIRYNKYGIEKLTKLQYNETLDRLRGSYGSKLAILHHEMAELQKDLEAINAMGSEFFDLTSMNPESSAPSQNNPKGMIPFLLRTKYLQEEAENLISKPIKTSIEVYPYDLPREVAQRKLLLQNSQANQDVVAFKNEVVWRLVEEKKAQANSVVEQFHQEASQECEEWSKLNQKLRGQLANFKLVCSFCGVVMVPDTVNNLCTENRSSELKDKLYTHAVPPAEHTGTGYHFFEKPVH